MFNEKKRRIKELEERILALSQQYEDRGSFARALFSQNEKLEMEKKHLVKAVEFYRAKCTQLSNDNDQLKMLIEAMNRVEVNVEPIATTKNAGPVTFQELAQLVIDGKPIERVALSLVEIKAYQED